MKSNTARLSDLTFLLEFTCTDTGAAETNTAIFKFYQPEHEARIFNIYDDSKGNGLAVYDPIKLYTGVMKQFLGIDYPGQLFADKTTRALGWLPLLPEIGSRRVRKIVHTPICQMLNLLANLFLYCVTAKVIQTSAAAYNPKCQDPYPSSIQPYIDQTNAIGTNIAGVRLPQALQNFVPGPGTELPEIIPEDIKWEEGGTYWCKCLCTFFFVCFLMCRTRHFRFIIIIIIYL